MRLALAADDEAAVGGGRHGVEYIAVAAADHLCPEPFALVAVFGDNALNGVLHLVSAVGHKVGGEGLTDRDDAAVGKHRNILKRGEVVADEP